MKINVDSIEFFIMQGQVNSLAKASEGFIVTRKNVVALIYDDISTS